MNAYGKLFPCLGRLANRRWALQLVGLLVLLPAMAVIAEAQASTRMRWDLVSVSGGVVSAGGMDTSVAKDSSTITLTGSGFFRKLPAAARFRAIAAEGGGNWQSFDSTGTPTGSGTYKVLRGPAYFQGTTGALPASLSDTIGDSADARAGMLVVEVEFSDGDRGVLGVFCALPGAPATNFEGFTVTKGTSEYLTIGTPHFTLFHVVPTGES
jgi:hypothetical protein